MFRLWDERRETPSVRPTIKPILEIVEDRILLSSANMNPLASVAVVSPPAAPSIAAVVSYVVSTVDQVMAAEQQEVRALVTIIAQEQAYFIQQVEHFFGIPTSPNPTLATTVHKSGSGSGSGTGAMPPQPIVPKPGDPRTPPVTKGSGIGFDAGPGSGGGLATIYGQVWLDNNGDGSLDNGELGYSDPTVNLCTPSGQVISSTTGDVNGNYSFTVSAGGQPPTNEYEIQLVFPFGFMATIQGADSVINNQGYSPVYALSPGDDLNVPIGMRSMNVTTTADDANGPIKNTITLRDAIETGNNGPPAPAVTFYTDPQEDPVTGTITLQAALPAIATSYNINGPGAATLTVNGNNAAGTILTVNAGVTSTISGLTIKGGSGANGGGISNNGSLTLKADTISSNNVTGQGGGIYNVASMKLLGVQVEENSALTGGGIYTNGKLVMAQTTNITDNKASSNGAGIYVNGGTAVMLGGGVTLNTAQLSGGGIYVNRGELSLQNGVLVSTNSAVGGNGAGYGGGIYINKGTVSVSGGTIGGCNSAGKNGGGIYNLAGTLTLKESINNENVNIDDNVANNQGGGVYLAATSFKTTFDGVDVSGNLTNGNPKTTGWGIYLQNGANVLGLPLGLTDNDDPNGNPVPGP